MPNLYPKPIQRLIEQFQKLPGIGPKQAARFAFKVLRMSDEEVRALSSVIGTIKDKTRVCGECGLTFEKLSGGETLCPFCADSKRDRRSVAVVETDRDAYTIEHSGAFSGVYHILGAKVSLAADSLNSPALRRLEKRLAQLKNPEVIIATSATTDGGATTLFLERALAPLNVKISRLGRGLSSGIEIEYADRDTLVDAFKNRK